MHFKVINTVEVWWVSILDFLRADQNLDLPPRLPKTALTRAVDLRSERDLDGKEGMAQAHTMKGFRLPEGQIFRIRSPLSQSFVRFRTRLEIAALDTTCCRDILDRRELYSWKRIQI